MSQNIIDEIKQYAKFSKNNLFQLIARKILEGFYTGKFYKEKDLAEICFTGCSTITKFAKKMGLSGYRELVLRIHYEYEIFVPYNKESVIVKNSEEDINKVFQWIINNLSFIELISNKIVLEEEITFFVSYQIYDSVVFFEKILKKMNIKTKIFTGQDIMLNKRISNDSSKLNLIIVMGQDNTGIVNIVNNLLKDEEKNIFLISTQGQREKIKISNIPQEKEIIIKSDLLKSTDLDRNMLLTNLFFTINKKIIKNVF